MAIFLNQGIIIISQMVQNSYSYLYSSSLSSLFNFPMLQGSMVNKTHIDAGMFICQS